MRIGALNIGANEVSKIESKPVEPNAALSAAALAKEASEIAQAVALKAEEKGVEFPCRNGEGHPEEYPLDGMVLPTRERAEGAAERWKKRLAADPLIVYYSVKIIEIPGQVRGGGHRIGDLHLGARHIDPPTYRLAIYYSHQKDYD